jgi:transcriptional regulator with XRE-family HTH domain
MPHPLVKELLGDKTPAQLNRICERSGVCRVTINSWLRDHRTPRVDLLVAVANAMGYELIMTKTRQMPSAANKTRIINAGKDRIEAWRGNKLIGYVENDILHKVGADGFATPVGPINHRAEIAGKLGIAAP